MEPKERERLVALLEKHRPDGPWRVGRSVGRTVYINDKLVGMMDTPELAELAALAVNYWIVDH